MPRSGARRPGPSQDETVSLHLRTDVLLSRRGGNREEAHDRSLVWNMHVEIPVQQMRLLYQPERVVVEEILMLIKDQFQSTGFVEEIARRTANLLAQDI
jgi:hypothetical protein